MTHRVNRGKPRRPTPPQKRSQPRYKDRPQWAIYPASSQVTICKDFNGNILEMPNRILWPWFFGIENRSASQGIARGCGILGFRTAFSVHRVSMLAPRVHCNRAHDRIFNGLAVGAGLNQLGRVYFAKGRRQTANQFHSRPAFVTG